MTAKDPTMKWHNRRMNMKLMKALLEAFPPGTTFTNKEAYELYNQIRTPSPSNLPWSSRIDPTDEYLQMAVRDTLSIAAYRGCLIRTSPGRYVFPTGIDLISIKARAKA
jgi:hypothetical protein